MPLKDYIQGKKQGKEANRLEREALSDPFLQEALDGFESVAGDHVGVVDRLEKRFTKTAVNHRRNINLFLYSSIAASILLLIGFSTFFFLLKDDRSSVSELAYVELEKNDEIGLGHNLDEIQSEIISEKETTTRFTPPPIPPAAITIQDDLSMEDIADAIIMSDLAEARVTVEERAEDESVSALMITEQEEQTLAEVIAEDPLAKVVISQESTQRMASSMESAKSKEIVSDSKQIPFGEKEFQALCKEKADKNVCNGKSASVKVSFFIDETGKPSKIEYKNYTCEAAKNEIENLLSTSPVWTKTSRKVTMTIKW